MEKNEGFSRLHKSLIDVIQEAQIKLGYDRHAIMLYYPEASVARLLDLPTDDVSQIEHALTAFGTYTTPTLGTVIVEHEEGRFCFRIPAEGAEYVHEKIPDNAFLRAFLSVVSGLEVDISKILAVFQQFSKDVICEKIDGNEECDYLIYFANGIPDAYRYCIKIEEDGCAVYHRFTPADYEAFGF